MKILVTGGAGYIGSHTVLTLLQSGHDVLVLDNLCNSSAESLNRVAQITGTLPIFIEGDVRNSGLLGKIFSEHAVDAVLHFAGLKAVGESISQPLRYYDNNLYGSMTLLQAMIDAGIYNLVFSSSATVYGDPTQIPISEICPAGRPTNPYGRSKQMFEDMLHDLTTSDQRWHVAILRYFNPVGAHESGLIGEDPNSVPNNLMPYITQVALGRLSELTIFGVDYPTPDGTGVRDYIHVMDLAEGHLAALNALKSYRGAHVWNLGTGRGYSVLQILKAFQEANGKSVPYKFSSRRPGDIASCYSDPTKAELDLGWKAVRGLPEMMRDAWRWQLMNPTGFR